MKKTLNKILALCQCLCMMATVLVPTTYVHAQNDTIEIICADQKSNGLNGMVQGGGNAGTAQDVRPVLSAFISAAAAADNGGPCLLYTSRCV